MNVYVVILAISLFALSCNGQPKSDGDRIVGGPCEDCEGLMDYELLSIRPAPTDTLPGFFENEPKTKITGRVFKKDGKTPAKDVLLYVYHVDRNGVYQAGKNPTGWENRHGQYRGWMKTDQDGRFTFYTFRPAPYPEAQEPEHIHIYIKEPTTIPYYIDSYLFRDDPTLTQEMIAAEKNRGGSGVIELKEKDGILTAHRDIVLGLNIPDYE